MTESCSRWGFANSGGCNDLPARTARTVNQGTAIQQPWSKEVSVMFLFPAVGFVRESAAEWKK
jgi:hypothetical protein